MDRQELMRSAKRLRRELILLGMALARDGDREAILSELNIDDLMSHDIKAAFHGLANNDKKMVLASLKRWGVEVESTVLEALVNNIREDANG
jgi:hypothetical protein